MFTRRGGGGGSLTASGLARIHAYGHRSRLDAASASIAGVGDGTLVAWSSVKGPSPIRAIVATMCLQTCVACLCCLKLCVVGRCEYVMRVAVDDVALAEVVTRATQYSPFAVDPDDRHLVAARPSVLVAPSPKAVLADRPFINLLFAVGVFPLPVVPY